MMAAVVTLGDFLESADQHFADSGRSTRILNPAEAAQQVRRLAAVMTRFLDAVTPDEAIPPDGIPDWALAAVHMRESARMSKEYLGEATGSVAEDLAPVEDPVVKHFTMAVDALTVGGDLLWSHVGTSPQGDRIARSDWAVLLGSEPLVRAVHDEVTAWAQRAVHVLDRLIEVPGKQIQGIPVQELSSARELLSAIAATHAQAANPDFDMADRRDLLRAIPSQGLRERVRPQPGESKADLCNEITASAMRLRAHGFAASQVPGESPLLSSDAWMNTARASAIVTDIACGLTRLLADRSTALGLPAYAEEGLRNATDFLATTCDAWRQVERMWRNVKTDTRFLSSPTVTETTDLILRTGRLLHGNPNWTPGSRTAPQSPASLARTRPALLRILGAVHETVDAVTRSARADLAGVTIADDSRRLYLPRRRVTDPMGRSLYMCLSGYRAHALMNAYHIVHAASLQAATALDTVALETGASSKTPALKRAAATAAGDVVEPEPGYELDLKTFAAQRLKYFDRPGGQSRDPKDIDPAQVIHAYEEAGLSVRECADRFMTFPRVIEDVLRQNGCLPRFEQAPARSAADQAAVSAQLDSRTDTGPVAAVMRDMGIKNPDAYVRAAAIDMAARDLVDEALKTENERTRRSARRQRTAAQLAALDGAPMNAMPELGASSRAPSQQAVRNSRAERSGSVRRR